ncbi:MAG: CPBP family intramembrane glutamic endopeptidase [Planctomycetota bacterium]|nr:CPBP family intramembrane glutamic endopeptidase [Planctomycetota bacterium]
MGSGYWFSARRPLQILAFLLPLIIAYELCLALLLPTEDRAHVNTVEAHRRLLDFFAQLGVARTGGLYLGGLVIVLVLLVWHFLLRDRWRIDPLVAVLMAVESFLLALPLLLLGHLIAHNPLAASVPGQASFADLDLLSQMAISVGAGLYEELVFRMVLIAVLHTLLVDVGKASPLVGASIAILVSAVAFTFYHDLDNASGALSGRRAVFYLAAGLYFGAIYVLRGFGIVVGAHALYDIIAVLLPASDGAD